MAPVSDPLATDLLSYIAASPTPFHCVAESVRRLEKAGFEALSEADAWGLSAGDARYLTRGDGSLLAVRIGRRAPEESGFRLLGAHTDSPNLRLKPRLAKESAGWLALDVEVYGGAIVASWADRDLGLAGRLMVEEDGRLVPRLFRVDEPLARVSTLAIHLDRKVNDEGLKLDKHLHLSPALARIEEGSDATALVATLLAEAAGVDPAAVHGHDVCLFDLQAPSFGGLEGELVFAPRLDNQAMCHAALTALLDAPADPDATLVVGLFDHEEIGSTSHRGARSSLFERTLGRLCDGPTGLARAMANSLLVSADMAHAVHPSRAEMHDGRHLPQVNGGPVVKTHSNQRYATDAESGAVFRRLCKQVGVPVQEFAMRADLPCGSTIGPMSAAGLGIRTVDVGNPMLSMHSIREMGGRRDPVMMTRVMTAFLGEPDVC